MDLKAIVIFFTYFISFVITFRHQKPVSKVVWGPGCKRHSIALNDCNWCYCDNDLKYQCEARVCENVDMFGHFKDAIQDINVGMEGHGSWRTRQTACTPGLYYRRGDILCACDEFGDWPNPVCRDLFRVLHTVVPTGLSHVVQNQSCAPTKLYLYGCNVCLCPQSGHIDENLCTSQECQYDDPIIQAEKLRSTDTSDKIKDAQEIYASCNPVNKYQLGCRNCTCLRNNRLLCNDCSSNITQDADSNYCYNKNPDDIFNIDCNLCRCDGELNMYCSSKKCISKSNLKLNLNQIQKFNWSPVPFYNAACKPGTQFKHDCNTCQCLTQENGEIFLDCSTNICNKNDELASLSDCVENTTYELNCMICQCHVVFGEKRQTCKNNPACLSDDAIFEKRSRGVNTLHGYCEPLHTYVKNCNNCTCMPDGKTLKCTSQICKHASRQSIAIDVVPIKIENDEPCLSGQSYKVNCNTCFCLSNGNAICTTADCSKKQNKYF